VASLANLVTPERVGLAATLVLLGLVCLAIVGSLAQVLQDLAVSVVCQAQRLLLGIPVNLEYLDTVDTLVLVEQSD